MIPALKVAFIIIAFALISSKVLLLPTICFETHIINPHVFIIAFKKHLFAKWPRLGKFMIVNTHGISINTERLEFLAHGLVVVPLGQIL